mmetsp:Transcript_31410/g.73327  ORF Transcript_31410/g.73327 Transcript_31410/m.73327 type:complete len:265 (-) Transcript_31410:102-896(-)
MFAPSILSRSRSVEDISVLVFLARAIFKSRLSIVSSCHSAISCSAFFRPSFRLSSFLLSSSLLVFQYVSWSFLNSLSRLSRLSIFNSQSSMRFFSRKKPVPRMFAFLCCSALTAACFRLISSSKFAKPGICSTSFSSSMSPSSTGRMPSPHLSKRSTSSGARPAKVAFKSRILHMRRSCHIRWRWSVMPFTLSAGTVGLTPGMVCWKVGATSWASIPLAFMPAHMVRRSYLCSGSISARTALMMEMSLWRAPYGRRSFFVASGE